MTAWQRLSTAIRRSVRYKLLALALFPILLALPAALALAVYWGGRYGYDQLYVKVSTDLSVAHDAFNRAQRDYLKVLSHLAESFNLRTDLIRHDTRALELLVERARQHHGFAFLHLVDRRGRWITADSREGKSRPSPLMDRAWVGEPSVGIEVYSARDLKREAPALADSVRLRLLPTPMAVPTGREFETRAMMIRTVYPVRDVHDNVRAVLDGGVLLNGNFALVDSMRDLVYGPGSLPPDSIGTVTIFLDDVRISTNVPLGPEERALGTRVSQEVREHVLGAGNRWIDRAFVVNDWYVSAYEPILDVFGRRIGMLYSGFLEGPFRSELRGALMTLLLLFAGVTLISAAVAVALAKSIFKPLEVMSGVVRATREGRHRRIGAVASRDEIGELAREFDGMLDLLQQRNRQIREAAESLEIKVDERTAELKRRNRELERTIQVLRETRRQLVSSEKLAALGELTAGMAHEINNPMAVILGNLDVLIQELGTRTEPVRNEIDLIIEQVYRVKGIIDRLLEYARPSDYAGYLDDVDVNEVIADTLKLVAHPIRHASVEVELSLKASRLVRLHRQDLQQVLVNLLVNAVHAMEPGPGKIWVTSRDWRGDGIRISVRDSGPGIEQALQDLIFNPFFSTKEVGEGTGLGLSISHGLIRRYGGNITLDSSVGQGTELTVWLLCEPQLSDDDATLAEQLRAIGSQNHRH